MVSQKKGDLKRSNAVQMADFRHIKPSFFIENVSDSEYPGLANKKTAVVILSYLNHS